MEVIKHYVFIKAVKHQCQMQEYICLIQNGNIHKRIIIGHLQTDTSMMHHLSKGDHKFTSYPLFPENETQTLTSSQSCWPNARIAQQRKHAPTYFFLRLTLFQNIPVRAIKRGKDSLSFLVPRQQILIKNFLTPTAFADRKTPSHTALNRLTPPYDNGLIQ